MFLSCYLKKKIQVSFNQYSTETEATFVSTRELEKGREFFKSGDYELALQCFTQSILCKATITNLSNRALTYLKLNHYSEALLDCDRVLSLDDRNLKALLRKAQALEGTIIIASSFVSKNVIYRFEKVRRSFGLCRFGYRERP